MARTIVALCFAALVVVTLLGLSLPDGHPLSNRDLDALVGGSDASWCWPCYWCSIDWNCVADDGCTQADVRCPNRPFHARKILYVR